MNKQLFLLLITPFVLIGQQKQEVWPPEIKSDTSYVFKKTTDIDLNLWVFNPPKNMSNESKPAIVFFFGGGWRSGSPAEGGADSRIQGLHPAGQVKLLGPGR